MNRTFYPLLLSIILCLSFTGVQGEEFELDPGKPFTPDPYAHESEAERDARMAWFREARFGMFIHWGIYAVPAGSYKGERIPKIGEWIMRHGEIPVEEYKAFAKEFNPVHDHPEFWAELAKEAGMRYMVITSKHHDGFALFPSAVTEWDIEDATPYGKDLIGPLAEAARAEGLKFGLYYSQAQDWVHPGGSKSGYRREGPYWDPAQAGNYNDYLNDIAIPQVGEILGRYQPDILWWDTPMGTQPEHAEKLIPLLRIAPGIIHNNRLGGGFEGDTETPEQHIPATGFDDRDWEVCMTMNRTWGYKSYDDDWKSTEDLLEKLCDIVSKGGNFLLNIGPKADGTIPQPSIDRLKEVGVWMDINGESIYGTSASPFYRLAWGRATKKTHEGGHTIYLQVFDWPEDGLLAVPGLQNIPASITLLDGGEKLKAKQEGDALVIHLPEQAPDPHVSVIKLAIDGAIDIVSTMPVMPAEGLLELSTNYVDIHNRAYSEQAYLGNGRVQNWTSDRVWISWTFKTDQPGTYRIQADIAASKPSKMTIGLADMETRETALNPTDESEDLVTVDLGEITIKETGIQQLELRPVRDEWAGIEIDTVSIRLVKSLQKNRSINRL